jgi:hypothetical protein
MADNIFTYESQDIDLKECIKITTNCQQLDTIVLQFKVYNYDTPVDLTNFNIAFEAVKSDGTLYGQVDNIIKSGNSLSITCTNDLTSVIGRVNGTLRIWTEDFSQKSSYFIVLNVFGIDTGDNAVSRNFVDVLERFDTDVNLALKLSKTFKDDITEAQRIETDFASKIPQANQIDTTLNNTISNANTINSTLTNAINNGNILEGKLSSDITIGYIVKSDLEASIAGVNSLNDTLITTISNADDKLQEFKNYDTTQLVPLSNTMLNEMYCNKELLSINHGLNGYPLVKMTYTEYGAGIGGAGDFPAGADSDCNLMQNKTIYKDSNNMTIYVPQDYYIANPSINKLNNYKYIVTFTNSTRSILIELIEGDIQNQVNENANDIVSVNNKLDTKTNDIDNTRTTTSKTVTGAINELDTNLDTVNSSLSQSTNILIPTSTSTENAIILNLTSFVNYKKYSFKANANSTGNVTINGKQFKKYDGTQIGSGGIKSGKVYDFYYDNTSDSVFILAKAEGNATVADVLAPKIFSNGDDIGVIGGIPSKTAQTYQPSTSTQVINAGQYISENQTIAPVIGNTTVNDVVSGKVFSSANGINLVGQATIESLGGFRVASGTISPSFSGSGSSVTVTALGIPIAVFGVYYYQGSSVEIWPFSYSATGDFGMPISNIFIRYLGVNINGNTITFSGTTSTFSIIYAVIYKQN